MSELTPEERAHIAEAPPLLPPPSGGGARAARLPSRRIFTVSTLVAVIGLLWISAGLYLLWNEVAQTKAQLAAQTETARQEAASLSERLEKAENQLGTVVTGDLEELRTQQEAVEGLLDTLRDKVERNPQNWVIAETAYLLRIANDRLHLDHDIATALVALETADQRLQALADPSLFEVRRLLTQEITALRALPTLDITGLALHLGALNDGLERLPFPHAPGTVVATESGPSDEQGWRKIMHDLWLELRKLVVIKHNNRADQVVLTPDERELLRQNLRLSLEAAQVALIRRDDEVFHDQLRRAQEWMERYYDQSAAPTVAALQEIARLRAVNIAPPLPNITASLGALEDWQIQRRNKNREGAEGVP